MHGNHDNRTRAPERGDTPDAARRFERFERISWREALAGIAGAPGRLSRYRRLYSRMLEDALCGRRGEHAAKRRQGE